MFLMFSAVLRFLQMFSDVFKCSQDTLNCLYMFYGQLDILTCVQDAFICSQMFKDVFKCSRIILDVLLMFSRYSFDILRIFPQCFSDVLMIFDHVFSN